MTRNAAWSTLCARRDEWYNLKCCCAQSITCAVYFVDVLLFYLTFQFTFIFSNVQTMFSPLFSASLATASKVSRFLFSNDMIVTWRHWSWWMRMCPTSSIWCFLRKKNESKWHPVDTQGLSYQDRVGNVGIYMKRISLGW